MTALPSQVDPTKARTAYGTLALPKLVRDVVSMGRAMTRVQNTELGSSELLICQRALVALCDMLHNPEHVSAAIQNGRLMAVNWQF